MNNVADLQRFFMFRSNFNEFGIQHDRFALRENNFKRIQTRIYSKRIG